MMSCKDMKGSNGGLIWGTILAFPTRSQGLSQGASLNKIK